MCQAVMQNPHLDNLHKRFAALSSHGGEIAIFDLEAMKLENMLSIEVKPSCCEWVGTSGALICGDANGDVHLFC